MIDNDNEINARIAALMGLEVLGEAVCVIYPDDISWHVSYNQEDAIDQASIRATASSGRAPVSGVSLVRSSTELTCRLLFNQVQPRCTEPVP